MDPRRLLPTLAVLTSVALAVTLLGHLVLDRDAPGTDRQRAAVTEAPARTVLREWDAARAAAWAQGDVAALRSLYTDGSAAGERDVAMLRRWVRRGFVVTGMRSQVLRWRVVGAGSGADSLVLEVTDRLTGAQARHRDGGRRTLPASTPRTRRITWRRVGGVWQVAASVPGR